MQIQITSKLEYEYKKADGIWNIKNGMMEYKKATKKVQTHEKIFLVVI